jgi:hypothetical protein
LTDPHILFGAIGDATCDQFPLQIGQFESGNEIYDNLSKFIIEGGGGGQQTESYELAMYFMARKTKFDSVDKRGKKGYMFIIGDELPYKNIKKGEVEKYIGDKLQENISTEKILEELREKFEVFWILPGGSNNYSDSNIINPLKKMFGQHLLKMEDPANVCELIAMTIGAGEGYEIDTMIKDLNDIGSDSASVSAASKAVSSYIGSKSVAKAAKVSGDLIVAGSDAVERL